MALDSKPDLAGTAPANFYDVIASINGTKVLVAGMSDGISKNPYLGFKVKGLKAGPKLVVNWTDNKGDKNTAEASIG